MLDIDKTQPRWDIQVSSDIDQSLREYLASNGMERKDDFSRFIEEAVRAHIFDLTAKEIKEANSIYTQEEIDDAIDEALTWARQQ